MFNHNVWTLGDEYTVPRAENAVFDAPLHCINEIVLGERAMSADTAVYLERYLGTSEKFGMELQADYDLEEVHRHESVWSGH